MPSSSPTGGGACRLLLLVHPRRTGPGAPLPENRGDSPTNTVAVVALWVTVVPGAGLEPACPRGRQILSLLRLPISPSRHANAAESQRSAKGDARWFASLYNVAIWRGRRAGLGDRCKALQSTKANVLARSSPFCSSLQPSSSESSSLTRGAAVTAASRSRMPSRVRRASTSVPVLAPSRRAA